MTDNLTRRDARQYRAARRRAFVATVGAGTIVVLASFGLTWWCLTELAAR